MTLPRALLFAEDETMCTALTAWIGEAGYRVDVVADEDGAADRLERSEPDVFVTARMVPRGPRLKSLGALRERHPQMRVLALLDGASARDFSPGTARALGFDGALTSPLSRVEVVRALDPDAGANGGARAPAAPTWSQPRFSPT